MDADGEGGQGQHVGDEGVEDLEAVVVAIDRIWLALFAPDVYSFELCTSEN